MVKDNNMQKIAVLITCFNSERFIARSLNSIHEMNVKGNVNVYIYDDCSTDSTREIIESAKGKYNYNISVLTGEVNVGPGVARNILIDSIVDEKYFIICDSDDSFKSNLIEELEPIIDVGIYDVIEFKHYYHNLNTNYITIPKNFIEKHGNVSLFEKEFFLKNNFYAWGKAYRTEFIKKQNIRFAEYRLYEDTKFVFNAVTQAKKYYSIDKYLFVSHPEADSETRKVIGSAHIECFSKAMEDVDGIEFYNSHAKKIIFFELFNRCKRYAIKTDMDHRESEKFLLDKWINLDTVKNIPKTEMLLHDYNISKLPKVKKSIWLKKPISYIYNYKPILSYIQNKYKNTTKFALVKLLHHEYKYTVFQGFDYTFRGNSKYQFLKLLAEGVEHLKFITESEAVPKIFRVKPYSSEHMYYLANAKTVYLESYEELNFCINEKTKLIQMWHGIPLKLMMLDSFEKSKPGVAQKKLNNMKRWDEFYYTGEYNKDKFKSAFELYDSQFVEKTPPRIEFMSSCRAQDIKYFKDKYKIGSDKFVISYFPTWRDSWKKNPRNMSGLLEHKNIVLPENAVVIEKTHPYVSVNRKYGGKVINGNHFDTEELLLISDVVISDYSSIIFDAQHLGKKVFLLCKDMEDYIKNRGLYREFQIMFKDDIYVSEFNIMRVVSEYKRDFL